MEIGREEEIENGRDEEAEDECEELALVKRLVKVALYA